MTLRWLHPARLILTGLKILHILHHSVQDCSIHSNIFYDKSGDYTVTPKCLFVIFENVMVKVEGQWHWSRQIIFSIDQWLSTPYVPTAPHIFRLPQLGWVCKIASISN